MPSHDTDYLGEALARQQARNAGRTPAEDLDAVVARRRQGLEEASAKNQALTAAYDKSLIGKLGLNKDGVTGTAVNLATQAGVGAVRGAGQLGRIVDESNVAAQLSDITEPEFRAYRRLREDEEALRGQKELEAQAARNAFKAELAGQSEAFKEAGPVGAQGQATDILDPAALLKARQAKETPVLTSEQERQRDEFDAYGRQALDEDAAVLGRTTDPITREIEREARGMAPKEMTVLERLRDAETSAKRSDAIGEATDFGDLGYSVDSEELQAELGEVWEDQGAEISAAWNQITDGNMREGILDLASKGTGLLVAGAEKFIDNPAGFAQFMAEELGEEVGMALLPGGRGLMTAANMSRATEAYNDGVQNFRAENGRAPNAAEKERLGGFAVLAWALDEVGDTATLASFRNPVRSGTRRLATAGGRVPAGMAVDGAAEAGQTAAEGEARYDPAEGGEIFTAGMLGAGVNAGASIPSEALNAASVVGKATNAQGKKLAGKLTEPAEPTKSEKVKEAEKSGDVSPLIDPEAPGYAPDEAMRILVGQNNATDATPEAQEAVQEQASAIMQGLEERAQAARVLYDKRDPSQRPAQQARMEELKAAAEAETDPDAKQGLEARIGNIETFIAQSDDPEVMKKEKAAIEALEKQLKTATEMQQQLTQSGVRSRQAETPAETVVAQINQTDDAELAKGAVLEMVGRIQQSPEAFSPEEVEQVLSSSAGALSPDQRRYLRTFSDSQQRANALRGPDGVRNAIVDGDKDFAGIGQYRARMAAQLGRDDKPQARQTLGQLRSFTKRHTEKAEAVAAAFEEVKGTDNVIGLVYDSANGWTRTPKLSAKERSETGGLNVSNNTLGLSGKITEEAALLKSAFQELTLSYRMAAAPAPVAATTQQGTDEDIATTQQSNPEEAADEERVDQGVDQSAEAAAEPQGPAEPAGTVDESDSGAEPVRLSETSEVNEAGQEFDPETGEILNEPLIDPEPTAAEMADRWTQDETIEPYGKLRPLTQALKQVAATLKVNSESFSRINLVQRFMDQRRKGRNGNPLPLVEVEAFLSELDRDPSLAKDFLGRELTPAEENSLANFLITAKQWQGWVEDSLPVKDDEKGHLFFRDPIKFLMEDGALEENVVTAISAAAYDYVTGSAIRPPMNDDKAINKILGREEDHPVSPTEQSRFAGAGDVRADASLRMGYQILDALGFNADNDAPMQLRETLAASLGARAMAMLVDTGVVEQSEITAQEMVEITGDESYGTKQVDAKSGKTTYVGPGRFFIKPTAQEGTPGREQLENIQEASEGALTLIPELLGLQSGIRLPGFQPVGFNQARAKNSTRGVPGPLAKILQDEGAKPHYLRQDALRVWKGLSLAEKKLIGGAVDPGTQAFHKANRKSQDAKNDDIERQIENFDRFVEMVEAQEDGLDAPFYLNREVWKMQRVGLTDTLINPQASKIHRHLISMGGWEINVDMAKDKSRTGFYMALAEAYGVKTDKQSVEASITEVKARMKDPAIVAGVEALQAREAGENLTPEQTAAIVAAAKAGKEKYYSLEALIAQAKFQTADDVGMPEFTVHLSREVDGKTNGPMLGQWQLGAAADADELLDTAVMGGFFDGRSGHTQVNEWASDGGNQDLYQRTARNIGKYIQAAMKKEPGRRQTYAAIEYFTGSLYDHGKDEVTKEGRNLVKNPVTILMFGASMTKIQDNVTDGLIHQVYDKIEALANDPATAPQQVQELVGQINQLLGFKNAALQLPANTSMKVLMEKEFSETEIDGIKETLKGSLNKAIKVTMENDFEAFIERRNQLNKSTKAAFLIYETAYRQERRALIAELVESGDMPVSGRTEQELFDLSAEQEAEVRARIRDMEPVMHSAFSKVEGKLANGIYLAKRQKEFGAEGIYGVQASFPKGFGKNRKGNGYKYMDITGNHWTDIEPGVSPMILGLHSLDSFIAASSYAEHMALNVHDALMTGLGEIEATGQTLNKNTLKGLMMYSVPNEMADALERTAQAFADRYSAEEINQDQAFAADYWAMQDKIEDDKGIPDATELEEAGQDPLGYLVDQTRTEARKADLHRLQGLRRLVAIDQYSLPGGNYLLTDEDYAAIDALIAKAEAVPETANAALVKQLKDQRDALEQDRVFNADGTSSQRTLEENEDGEIVVEQDAAPAPKSGETAWGKLGRSRFTQDPALVAYFEGNPNGTAGELLRFLNEHVKTVPGRNTRDFYRKLISGLYASVDRNMPVRYLSEGSSYDPATDQPMSRGALASYSPTGKEQIRVRGTDYQSSQVSLENVLHEMTHAVTAQVLRTQSDRPGVAQIKKDLEALREAARKEVHSQDFGGDLSEDETFMFRYAVSSIDELIAVGMTDRNFQRKVLNRVQVATGTRTNPLLSGMRSLIASLVKLVFRGGDKSAQELRENGLAVLIANVSMVAEENRKRVREPDTTDDAEAGLADSLESRARQTQDLGYLDLYDALGSVEDAAQPVHQARVRGLLDTLSQAIHGPFEGFRDALRSQEASSPEDVLIKARMTGQNPFASALMASGFDLTNQQLLAAEQIELTVRESLASEPAAYRELLKVWTEARKMITPESLHDGDWAMATRDEKEAAQEKHDFLFKMQAGGDARVNHLSRFAGLALASPELFTQLNQGTHRDTRTLAEMRLGEAIGVIFQRLLDMFNGRMTHTYPGQNANDKLTILAKQLVDNEAKHRRVLADKTLTLTDRLEVRATKAGSKIAESIEKAGRSDVLRNSRSAFVRAGGSLVSTVAGDRVEQLLLEIQKQRDRMFKGRQGMVASFVSEARGAHDAMTRRAFTLLREYAKTNEHERMKISETTSRVALEGFDKKGEDLDKKQRAALTRIGMRTDLNALAGAFTLDELEVLVRDPKARAQAIKDYEAKVDASHSRSDEYYVSAGKDLGYRMATGHVVSKNLMHNVHNIAYLAGTSDFGSVSDAQAEAVIEALDPLVSLYALEYSPEADRKRFSEIMRHEAQRGDDKNGVRDMLKLYGVMQEQAKDTLFEGSPVHMVKGYTSEIYDPYRTLVAELDDKGQPNSKAERLEAMGYERLGPMEKDSTDPDQAPKALFVIRDGGAVRRVTGSLSYTDERSRGTALHGGLSMVSRDGVNGVNARKNAVQKRARQAAINDLFTRNRSYDPRRVRTNRSEMAPILNRKGEITGYHYLMKQQSKDKALKRNNDFSSILGTMAGTNFDKPATKEQNRGVVKAMHEEYLADYHNRPKSYLRVGPDSPDPQLREYYNLLPHDTQQAVREIWGERGMWIRSDVIDVTFGYQKWSLTEGLGLTQDAELRNRFQQIASHFAESVFGPKVGLRIRQGEDFVMALVKEIKDFLVIKSGVTLLGNILSNMSVLLIAGVNPVKQVKLHREAIDSTLSYRRDSSELARLKALRSIEYVNDAGQDIEQRILVLEDALSRNKAHRLVEAGLMPTIVEDVDQHEDPFSYQSQFGDWVDTKTEKVWSPLKTAGRWAYMTHDTPLYKLLSETTQMSDFVARYVMYEHTTSRNRNPLSHGDAVQHASEMFVNYDIPTHRVTQYLNDTGLLLFTKYYIRIQRALMTLFRDNPARFMMTALLNNMMPGLPTILDSSAVGRIGNPLDAGPLLYPEAVGEGLTFQAGASLFR